MENNKIMKRIKKKGVTKQAKFPVGIRHLRGVDMEKEFQVKLPVGIRHPNFLGILFIYFWNVTFDMSLDMRVHTTSGTS